MINASVGFNDFGDRTVTYSMMAAGADRWCRFTTNNTGSYAPIVVDNAVVTDPSIQAAICDSQSEITLGQGGTKDEARRIAAYLNSGAYPAGIRFRLGREQ